MLHPIMLALPLGFASTPSSWACTIVPSLHAGTIWEIEQILEADALDRTLWLMPSVRGGPRVAEQWEGVRTAMRPLGLSMPQYERAKRSSEVMYFRHVRIATSQ